MLEDRAREAIAPGAVIPKPQAKGDFVVKGWGKRRGEHALIYRIQNHRRPEKPYEKGITVSEFDKAFSELKRSGEFTRSWFEQNLPECAKEGGCNFTSIGGIFILLKEATYWGPGIYRNKR